MFVFILLVFLRLLAALIMSFLTFKLPCLTPNGNGERGRWVYIREYNKPVAHRFSRFFFLSLLFFPGPFFSIRGLFISPSSVLEIAKENFDSHRCNDRLSITHFPQLCRAKHSFQRDIKELYHFAVGNGRFSRWLRRFRSIRRTSSPNGKRGLLVSVSFRIHEKPGKTRFTRSSEIKPEKRQRDGGMFSIYFPKGRVFLFSTYTRPFPFAPLFVLRIFSCCTEDGKRRTDGSCEGFYKVEKRQTKFKHLPYQYKTIHSFTCDEM